MDYDCIDMLLFLFNRCLLVGYSADCLNTISFFFFFLEHAIYNFAEISRAANKSVRRGSEIHIIVHYTLDEI